jgi:hypothetical protein
MRLFAALCVCAAAGSSFACGPTVFFNTINNGFFTPFSSSTPASVRYGDSGWFGSGSDQPVDVCEIRLTLAVFNSTRAGSTDISFSFHDGDPSRFVFGSGDQLYQTTIQNVQLPNSTEVGGLATVEVVVPLPGVRTRGGFQNFGWAIGVSNFDSDGQFGFTCSSTLGQTQGFYTNNAAFFDGTSWSLFSFGPDPVTGVANFVAELKQRGCDSIDFNGNGVFPEDQDVIDFFTILAGGPCDTGTCGDIDFNNNGVFPEDQDVVDFFNVLAGGACS